MHPATAMTPAPATLDELVSLLGQLDPDLPVHFRTDAGDAGPGYHITEVMVADIRSIDCGGTRNGWREARMQLRDGAAGDPQGAGKMASILARSREALPDLDGLPLVVEFGHGNASLSMFRLGPAVEGTDRLTLTLDDGAAICKPAARAREGLTPAANAGCCSGTSPATASACCA